jgi:cell division transport system permease protein
MQMVGAGNSFIRKPFLQQSLWLGFYGSLAANIIIITGIYSYRKELEGIISLNDINTVAIVVALIIVLGLLFSFLSTHFAVSKFLKMKFDEMFY